MKTEKIQEGTCLIEVPTGYKLDSKMPVFYNSVQNLNRDISILLLSVIERKSKLPLRVLDLLAASGIRGLRIKKEVPNCEVTLNDYNKEAYKLIRKNAKLNKVKVTVENKAAHVLLSERTSYEYIDLDPFGTPVPFLDAAIKRLSPHAILAVTATDTSALCGAAPRACIRKYGSKPFRSEFMHENAIRILIKKCQEVAAQYDVALLPIFVHSSNHYVRVYLQKYSSAKKADDILKKHGHILYCRSCLWRKTSNNLVKEAEKCPTCSGKLEIIGPVWLGNLWDRALVKRMIEHINKNAEKGKQVVSNAAGTLTRLIYKESSIPSVGFYDLHWIAKKKGWKEIPKLDTYISKIKGVRTHFRPTGFRIK
jgi:tRNA (guanine26-N2/guanine27-N2)-dimethyltransferase